MSFDILSENEEGFSKCSFTILAHYNMIESQ